MRYHQAQRAQHDTQHGDQDQHGDRDDKATSQPPSYFEVFISRSGTAVLDGERFPVPEGETVHTVLLDVMHRHAQARGEPVEAAIIDRQAGYATRIEVAPDGSSRILHHEAESSPSSLPGAEDTASPVEDPEVRQPSEPESHEAGNEPPSAAFASEPAILDEPAFPDEPAVADELAVPDESALPDEPAVPDECADLVAYIAEALDDDLERAAVLAFRLRGYTTSTYGAEHRYTLEAHNLEAYVAHTAGHHRSALTTCLLLARIRHRQGDSRADEDLQRAIAAWWELEEAEALAHGRELVAVWSELVAGGGPTGSDTTMLQRVKRRLDALSVETVGHSSGAA
ncbi:hypothetical protein ACIBL8_38405 [Streptomyces sp. NPDC050523]|uniref:hypothetical protein n=1 Tax=Streptomyces sp. NPDC050523 TaxID=3365622 RepID=UPI003798A804